MAPVPSMHAFFSPSPRQWKTMVEIPSIWDQFYHTTPFAACFPGKPTKWQRTFHIVWVSSVWVQAHLLLGRENPLSLPPGNEVSAIEWLHRHAHMAPGSAPSRLLWTIISVLGWNQDTLLNFIRFTQTHLSSLSKTPEWGANCTTQFGLADKLVEGVINPKASQIQWIAV